MLLVCVMVTATVSPVSADELPAQSETLSPEQPAAQESAVQEPQTAVDVDAALQEPQTQPVEAQEETAEEPQAPGQQTTETVTVAEAETVVEPDTQIPPQTGTEPVMGEDLQEAQAPLQTESVPGEAVEETAQVNGSGGLTPEDLYDNLTEEQIKFNVYTGTKPIEEMESDADILSKLNFMADGVVPDSANLDAQAGKILAAILDGRQGDDRFYALSSWKLWSVDSDGKPQFPAIAKHSSLSRVATKDNFIQSAYMEYNVAGTDPIVICKNPVLEPIWSCLEFIIHVYDQNGVDTGLTITVTAENYNDAAQVAFPATVEAGSWKLLYDGSEYTLNNPSEIWTNTTNGIGTIGRSFDAAKAKLQAFPVTLQEGNADFRQPDWYFGQQPAAPQVSSETNGIDNITYYYKAEGADDSTYTAEIPTAVGRYTAKAVFAATGIYKEVVKIADFSILPAEPEVRYEISGLQGTEGWYRSAVTISAKAGYQVRLSETDAWTEAVTVAQSGNVTLYVKAADGTEYPAEQKQFLIDDKTPEIVGLINAEIVGLVNGMTYYGDIPAAVTDDFLIKVTVNDIEQPIVDNHADFVLKPSEEAYIIKADDMAGNWVEAVVFVKEEPSTEPPSTEEPSEPSTEEPTEPSTEQPSEPSTEPSTEEPTEPIEPPTEAPDKTAPVISGIENKGTYYGTQNVTVMDENLRAVTVNGKSVTITDNRAEVTLTPTYDEYQFVIIAEDAAGNKTEYTVEVWEKWVLDGIVENGKKKLRRERSYKLGSGKWTVAGDSTVYQGGRTFYVNSSGTYDFKKK